MSESVPVEKLEALCEEYETPIPSDHGEDTWRMDSRGVAKRLRTLIAEAREEVPNALTRDTMTATEAGRNVFTTEDVDALIEKLDRALTREGEKK